MGNYKFRLSDMMPNAWFYKLRDMNKAGSKSINKKINNPRKSTTSFYQTTEYISPNINPRIIDNHDFPHDEPPRKSSKRRSKRKTIYKPSPIQINPSSASASSSSDCIDFPTSPDQFSSPCSCKLSSSATDIILDMDQTSYKSTKYDKFSDLQLPPILTKPVNFQKQPLPSTSSSSSKEKKKKSRKSVSRSTGVKIKGIRWNQNHHVNKVPNYKKNDEPSSLFYSSSFAIVKASLDPEHDFRESMMEMIVENNIRASKDLEDLLACYLSLNSNQYHHLIIKAFEQIWFNMPLN